MKKQHPPYCEETLRQLWADGKTHWEIADALGCSELYIRVLRRRHNLPRRPNRAMYREAPDPTPEEIAERAAECRKRHMDAMRHETDNATHKRKSKIERTRLPSIRVVAWDGYRFTAVD